MKTNASNLVVITITCFTVLNPWTHTSVQGQGPDVVGEWGSTLNWPLQCIHMILLKNGKVLCVDDRTAGNERFILFNPPAQTTSNLVVITITCFTVLNPWTHTSVQGQGPDVVGEWGSTLNWPLQCIHMILLKNGKVLCVDDRTAGNERFILFNPPAQTIVVLGPPPNPPIEFQDIFCSGHTHLTDGRVVFFGGGPDYNRSHAHTVIFDPDAASTPCTGDADCTAFTGECDVNAGLCDPWTVVDDMPPLGTDAQGRPLARRWYPTATTLSDGRVLVVSGGQNQPIQTTADIPIVLDATLGAGAQFTSLTAAERHLNWYPMMFQVSDGTMFMGGALYADADLISFP